MSTLCVLGLQDQVSSVKARDVVKNTVELETHQMFKPLQENLPLSLKPETNEEMEVEQQGQSIFLRFSYFLWWKRYIWMMHKNKFIYFSSWSARDQILCKGMEL